MARLTASPTGVPLSRLHRVAFHGTSTSDEAALVLGACAVRVRQRVSRGQGGTSRWWDRPCWGGLVRA